MNRSAEDFNANRENTPWLSQFAELLSPGTRVLDLGCGTGADSRDLASYGCQVVALDRDPVRVRQVPEDTVALRLAADLTVGLPFRDGTFDRVVASLSLHYFPNADTQRAIRDVARVLKHSGWLLCRVNAVGDVNFGYGQGEEVELSLFKQPEGHLKRFFDEPMLAWFLEPCFSLKQITPRVILQKGLEKRTLECLAQKD